VTNQGAGLRALAYGMTVLAAWAAVSLAVALRVFRWK
jgi:hypothetical protein